ncbi:MAG: amidohydrolase [candidate division Zixibacteria bacterium]|nr:amidohydrolase [candidate division Zixibacteria bacterium]
MTKFPIDSRLNRNLNDLERRILNLSGQLYPGLIRVRRHLHERPELANEEFATTQYLKERLQKIGAKIRRISLPTGIVAEVGGRKKGPTVVIRSDLDALPIKERTGLSFASKFPGKMHACGHDAHMTIVFGAACVLSKLKEEFAGNVRFIFQPSEEQPPGGATPMIKAGALAKPKADAILGLHVDPRVAVGKIGLRDGVTMAAVIDFDLTVTGKSGHAARPQEGVDAIVIASEIIDSLQKIISRETDPFEPLVLTVGKISGGVARNVIAREVVISGTMRALNIKDANRLPGMVRRIADNICRARGAGAKARLDIIATYPSLSNVPWVNEIFKESFDNLFGKNKVVETEPVLGGEDFACYLKKVPGAMVRLGIRNSKIGATKYWHSDEFMIDERAIYYGVALLTSAALRILKR